MNTLNKYVLGRIMAVALIFATVALPQVNAAQVNADNRDITISYVVDPIYPVGLSMIGVFEGSATIIISVDDKGNMMDWIALSATDKEFVKSIENVIHSWKFKPAYRNGEPVASAVSVSVKFKNDGVVMSMNSFQMVQALLNRYKDLKEHSLVARYSDLDHIPEPIKIVQPAVAAQAGDQSGESEVIICFFIDAEGHVRIPVLMQSTSSIDQSNAAYDALMQWEFAKPISHGRPTMVRASQKFIFKDMAK